MSESFGMHLIGETLNRWEYEGGGNAIVRCLWGLWTPHGAAVAGTGGMGPCVSGFNIWECATIAARETREMLAGWRKAREGCPYYLPLFAAVGGAA